MTNTIKLGRTTYQITRLSADIVQMTGPRGGDATLVRNRNNPAMWALIKGTNSTWYRATSTGLVAQ